MNEISKGQELYLKNCRKHKRIVQISRILILFSFLFLWEFTANTGIIDSFIFSSPSKIALCVRNMAADKSIFLHIGITLYETIVSFLLVIMISVLVAVALWFSVKLSEILDPYLVVLNSLPKSALAPLLIVWLGADKATIIVAGMSVAIFGSILNLYTSFTTVDAGKDQTDLYNERKPVSGAYESGASQFFTRHYKQYEGKYRALSCGCYYR